MKTRSGVYFLAAALMLAGCAPGPVVPGNLRLAVANASSGEAIVDSVSPGPLGLPFLAARSTMPIASCTENMLSFGPGHQQITISSAHMVLDLAFDLNSADQRRVNMVVNRDGTITQVSEDSFPDNPCPEVSPQVYR